MLLIEGERVDFPMYRKPVLKSLNVFVFSLSEISAVLLIKGGWWVGWSIIGPTGPSAAQTKLNSLRKTIAQSTSGKTQSTSGHSNPLQEKHLAHSQITEITFLRNYHLCWSPTHGQSNTADFEDMTN